MSTRAAGYRGSIRGVKNRHRLTSLAHEAGIPTTKGLQIMVAGASKVVEVAKSLDELEDELREAGLL